ncbi:MAG: tetratricopeptide repeat protein [Anaerolineae bacterium]|nr:tetratricopeptide repeat protein [Anaerolineae bacterium]
MYIKRDYSQPFFGNRRRRRGFWRFLLLYILGIVAFLFVVDSQFPRLQMIALSAIGQAPEPTPFASQLATDGLEAFRQGNVKVAAQLFERAVAQQPTNIDYLYEYGRMLIENEQYSDAVDIGRRGVEAAPGDPRGYAIEARAMDYAGDSANSIPVAQAGLQIDRYFAPLHTALAGAYNSISRYQQALDAGEEAVRLDPNDPDARRAYAFALIWVGRFEEAVEQLERAIAINPNLVAPYFELAIMYRSLERYEEAIATYELVLSMQPDNIRAYLRLCETFYQVRDDAQATGYCNDAIQRASIDPTNTDLAEAYRQRGQIRYSRRNYEGAIEDFDQCVALGSEDIECWYIRGLAHYYLGGEHCDEAWNVLNEAMVRISQQGIGEPVLSNTLEGLRLVTDNCSAYFGRALPTEIPPTLIPPTPIGG